MITYKFLDLYHTFNKINGQGGPIPIRRIFRSVNQYGISAEPYFVQLFPVHPAIEENPLTVVYFVLHY